MIPKKFHRGENASNQDNRITAYRTEVEDVTIQSIIHLGIFPPSGFVDEVDILFY
jgi:hypothetical protein